MNLAETSSLLAALVPVLVALAGAIGHRLGSYLATTGKAYVEMQLKAKRHDELVPVVEALAHGLTEGGHDPSLDAAVKKSAENGSIDHPVIQTLIAGGPK